MKEGNEQAAADRTARATASVPIRLRGMLRQGSRLHALAGRRGGCDLSGSVWLSAILQGVVTLASALFLLPRTHSTTSRKGRSWTSARF